MEKIKALYLAHKPPFPTADGGTFAMQRFIDCLQDFDLDACILSTDKHPFPYENTTYYDENFQHTTVFQAKTKLNPLSLLIQTLSGKSYHFSRFENEALMTFLNQNVHQYAYIFCDSIYAAIALKTLTHLHHKVIVRSHNVEHHIWEDLARNSAGPKKWLLQRMSRLMKTEELALLKQVRCVLSIIPEEVNYWKNHNISNVHYLPVSITVAENTTVGNECFFIGAMNWGPNKETVNYLTTLFKDEKQLQNISLHLAGSFSEKANETSTHIHYHGKVSQAETFMSTCGILVAPMFSGSGVKIKLLEALSLGCTVITNKKGAEGIDSTAAGILLAETQEELIAQIAFIRSHPDEQLKRFEQGKAYIRMNHSVESCSSTIQRAIES